MLDDLSAWEIRLERLWEYGEVQDVLDLCLLDTRIKYPTLDIVPFVDMIRGMLMDIPGLGQDRYGSWDELHLYCYRVAGTVGLMSMPVFGCASGFTEEIAPPKFRATTKDLTKPEKSMPRIKSHLPLRKSRQMVALCDSFYPLRRFSCPSSSCSCPPVGLAPWTPSQGLNRALPRGKSASWALRISLGFSSVAGGRPG